MKKIHKMNEAAWLLGIILCSLGVALCTRSDLGLSMIAAPAYIISQKVSAFLPWYTQGTSEYIFQGALLVLTAIVCKKFKPAWLLSFSTAIIFGKTLDLWFFVFDSGAAAFFSGLTKSIFGSYFVAASKILLFTSGELVTALAIAFYFRTTMPIQVYELFVTQVAETYSLDKNKVKLANDAVYFASSILLALTLNKNLSGIGIGTVIITIVNAPLIAFFGKILDKIFVFDSLFKRQTFSPLGR